MDMNEEQDGLWVVKVGRRKGSRSRPVALFGCSSVGTSGSARKNSQLVVGIKHSNVKLYIRMIVHQPTPHSTHSLPPDSQTSQQSQQDRKG